MFKTGPSLIEKHYYYSNQRKIEVIFLCVYTYTKGFDLVLLRWAVMVYHEDQGAEWWATREE